ncbi:MAG: multifunctional oxoglutarate decarboxylase/oxoglutarate dehydrogenase thiamine pyrophosphate-binding subunit/dihydrolipoyllysine-residue succinyltransferase subunit, partial [Ardenticatenaceae bacterium]
ITLTNPGTIGTIASVPRLMEGQGTIVATGAIAYPAEYSATDPDVLTELGVSKVMGITSTYDHRIIQGAESGMFLAEIHRLLLGEEGFYDRIFRSLVIPYPPVRWAQDNKPMLMAGAPALAAAEKEAGVLTLIRATRVRGHLLADLNPLGKEPKEYHPDLDPATYGLTLWDLDRQFITGGLAGVKRARLREILDILRRTYSGHIGIEFMNIQNPVERRWLQDQLEHAKPLPPLPEERKREILDSLSKAEAFEQFLHRRYVGSKRFSLEGAESVIPLMETILDRAAQQGIKESVMGMAHRGRLNVLKNIMQKSARAIFSEFEGSIAPESTQGTGDVKYHLGAVGVRRSPGDHEIELTLASNPSHLEAVDPVVEGMAHAKQRLRVHGLEGLAIDEVLPVLLHGDAAFAGQGIVAETLNLAQLRGYRTGGTIHIIINNQIGFTTTPTDARSTPFPTDIAKMSQIPIFHVNGDDPEAVVRVGEIALDYRQQFHKDVVIDLICYRRWGHNEADDPSYTQPAMYKLIEQRNSPREVYAQQLLRDEVISQQDAQEMYDRAMQQLEAGTEGLSELPEPKVTLERDETLDLADDEPPQTTVDAETLIRISRVLANPPEAFVGHPKLLKQIRRRELKGDGKDRVDWATAELLAFGSLLLEGHPVRLSGQDSGRGTFSQRHSVLHNYEEDAAYVPLNHLADRQAPFRVYDSMLSEEAVLGFEFGYSLAASESLVLWEAQFGDFANGAQTIIDQFISSSGVKWGRYSDLVLLLPHGYEGQGPEHSSARLERFLQLCAEDN